MRRDIVPDLRAVTGISWSGNLKPLEVVSLGLKSLAVAVSLVASLACIASPSKVEADTLSRFWANSSLGCKVLSEDLTTSGYTNRFHFVMWMGGGCNWGNLGNLGQIETMVLVRAEYDGSMYVRVQGWGDFWLWPMDPNISRELALAAPGAEDRWQSVTISPYELYVEER